MNRMLDEIILENDITFLKLQSSIEIGLLYEDTLTVESSDIGDGISTFFANLIKRISECIKLIKTKTTEFVSSITVKTKVDTLETAIKEDPSIATRKVKIIQYEELEKLNDETQKKLQSTNDVNSLMEKYRKQRNTILKAGAITTVTLGAALVIITKKKDKKINDLSNKLKSTESNFERLKARYSRVKKQKTQLSNQNKDLKNSLELSNAKNSADKVKIKANQISRDLSDVNQKAGSSLQVIKQTASAETEVLSNASRDVVNYIKDAVKACTSEDLSFTKKTGAVLKSVKKTTGSVTNVINGEAKKEVSTKNTAELKQKIKKIMEKQENAKKVLKDSSKSKDVRSRAKAFLDVSDIQIKKLKTQYAVAKNDSLK